MAQKVKTKGNIELGERLLEIREDLKCEFSYQVANKVGADPSYYAKAENGWGLSVNYLDVFIEKYKYNKAWLYLGEGEPKKRQGA